MWRLLCFGLNFHRYSIRHIPMFQKIVQCDKFYDQRQLISPVDATNWILIAWCNQVDIKYSQTASMHCNARYYPESASQLRLSSKPQSCAHRMECSDVIWTSCTPAAINSCRKVFITPVDTARFTATATRRDWTCSSQLQWVSDRRRQSQRVARVSHTKRLILCNWPVADNRVASFGVG